MKPHGEKFGKLNAVTLRKMASVDVSSEALSEETFEYKCTAGCLKKNWTKEAVKACTVCKKYFCPACLEVHDSIIDNHNTVQPSDLFSSQPTTLPTEQCKKHVGKMVDVWCVQHDVVGCVSCALFDHRLCENMTDIPSEINEIFNQDEFDRVKVELNNSLEYLMERKHFLTGVKENLLVKKNAQISKIEQYAQKLLLLIKDLENTAKKEINEKFKEIEDKVEKLAGDCRRFEEDIRQSLEQMDSCVGNKPQMFITMKNAQKTNVLADKNCQEPEIAECNVVIKPDSNIEQYLSGLQSLGTSSSVTRQYKLKHKQGINIKMSDDTKDCNIEGSCLLPDGNIVIIDYFNQKLKHVDISSSSVIDSCTVPGSPYGVCFVDQQEIVVALWDNTLQFVTLGRRMTLSRKIGVDHNCYGIAYHNGELFVSDKDKTIYVYNMQGSLLRKLTNITSERCRYLAVSRDGEKVFSACSNDGLVCTDRHGNPIYTYTDKNIDLYHGVCLDNRSSLFVCGFNSDNVVQLSESGKKVGEFVNKSGGVYLPQSLCFDPSRQRLTVAQYSNTVLIFELEL